MIEPKKFQRTIEDFQCEACGAAVHGTGYTNHCPKCLTSKHVDVAPGDRAATCGGLMPVVQILYERGDWHVLHQCQQCGVQKKNRLSPDDDRAYLAQLMKEIAQRGLVI